MNEQYSEDAEPGFPHVTSVSEHGGDEPVTGKTSEPPAKRRRSSTHIRTRVSRACDRCKGRKTRCSGKWPCSHCARVGRTCSFTAEYRRGRLPSIEAADEDDMDSANVKSSSQTVSRSRRQGSATEAVDQDGLPVVNADFPSPVSVERQQQQQQQQANSRQNGRPIPRSGFLRARNVLDGNKEQASAVQSSRNSPEPAQVDQQGHYVGPASGASFLLRIQWRLQQQSPVSSEGSIFTFGDLPLPDTDSSVLVLPPKTEADQLLGRYFEFASATHRYLHRPTVQSWLNELYDTNGLMNDRASARSRKAVLYMVIANAQTFPRTGATHVDPELSAIFFSAADDQLSGEKGVVRLASIQARLSQCFYLLSHSRLNHCWTLFGTVAHLALALGVHRKWPDRPGQSIDYVDQECRKRTFWSLYNLDVYLSAALGRPRTFHDDDIDQEIPLSINDSQLHSRQIDTLGPATSSQSVMSGAVAHFRLSRIVANILKDFYGIRSRSTESQLKLAEVHTKSLGEWRKAIAYLLDTAGVDSSLFLPIFLRQRNVLNLAFWHAQILLYRPFLLNSFASLFSNAGSRNRQSENPADVASKGELCLGAAMQVVKLVDELAKAGQLYSNFWFTHYFAFCAVVILYVHTIQRRSLSIGDHIPTLQAAIRCQSQISSLARPGSLSERYGVVLGELRLELFRHKPDLRALFPDTDMESIQGMNILPDDGAALHCLDLPLDLGMTGADGQGLSDGQFPGPSPSSSIAQMTGWERFDSLVTGGFGGSGWESIFADNLVEGWDLTAAGL